MPPFVDPFGCDDALFLVDKYISAIERDLGLNDMFNVVDSYIKQSIDLFGHNYDVSDISPSILGGGGNLDYLYDGTGEQDFAFEDDDGTQTTKRRRSNEFGYTYFGDIYKAKTGM